MGVIVIFSSDEGEEGEGWVGFGGGGGGSSISPASSGLLQPAKNIAAVSMTVVSIVALKAAVNRRVRRRANAAKRAKILPLPLPFLRNFINNSSGKIKLRYKTAINRMS
jgi:hypothetical protein